MENMEIILSKGSGRILISIEGGNRRITIN